ncbi:MAG TPA: c-type cytochrome [Casimicrobiaceae bacterium]|nr:c-type cytochrome [Casimicrobiaceae bacterium]
MKRMPRLLCIAYLVCFGASAQAQEKPPAWAYPVNPPDFKAPPDDGSARSVPGSSVTFTLTQVRDLFYAPDWHAADHPALPDVVARGRKPDVYACGFCHRADGPGGPENANLMGLPANYIKQQVADFKSGARKSSVMDRAPMSLKVKLASAVSDDEVAAAAAYFSTLKPRAVIRVTETQSVPATVVAAWFLVPDRAGGTEPIGERIIEVADDVERFVSRDTHVTFTAHVPTGSIQKGRELAGGKDGVTFACASCHGANLKGAGDVPGIAGKSPTYLFRQLYDYKHGVRAGPGSAAMLPSVQKLTTSDMIALAAYAGSLSP